MPMWCLADNECLACSGGCVGYESKREKMADQRAAYQRAVAAHPDAISAAAEFSRLLDEDLIIRRLLRESTTT